MTLYHFTCRPWLPIIQYEGIVRGIAPISADDFREMPNLTSDGDPFAQKWGQPRAGFTPHLRVCVRITLEIPPDDPRLISFDDFAARHGMTGEFCAQLDEQGGFGAKHWYYYEGVVTPDKITAVDFFGDDEPSEIESIVADRIHGVKSWAEASSLLGFERLKGGFQRFRHVNDVLDGTLPDLG